MPEIIHLSGHVTYGEGLRLQHEHVESILNGTGHDRVYLLEHEPVYSIGRQRDQSSLRNPTLLPHPVFETNRGGQATYHGPGQLVGYPIIDLTPRGRDLHAYLRDLEEILIRSCARFGVTANRREGLTGVWVENRKIASIGVGVRRWVTMHGFALNITAACLPSFLTITPCGIDGVVMTSLESEAGRPIGIEEAASAVSSELDVLLGGQ